MSKAHMIWWQPFSTGASSMLSAIISTHESERALVPTLAALVPAVATGLLGEVVVADAGSGDATAEVAELAGCRCLVSNAPLGARLKSAAQSTRSPWLLFLRAGVVPERAWVESADGFIQAVNTIDGAPRAAVFRSSAIGDLMRPAFGELIALLRVTFGGGARPEQGLLIARRFYDAVGGHAGGDEAEAALLRRLGRRRIAMLQAGANTPR
jgi:glycosyltransferase involved in cell wall biosynthesis